MIRHIRKPANGWLSQPQMEYVTFPNFTDNLRRKVLYLIYAMNVCKTGETKERKEKEKEKEQKRPRMFTQCFKQNASTIYPRRSRKTKGYYTSGVFPWRSRWFPTTPNILKRLSINSVFRL